MSDIVKSAQIDLKDVHGVSNLKGPLVLRHGDTCEGCLRIARLVLKAKESNPVQ